MIDGKIYLGLPGNLSPIYYPSGGYDATRVRDTAEFLTANGGSRVGKLLNGVRTYTFNYMALGYDSFSVLEAYAQGHMGPGPFVLLEPGRRNLLTVNQSASTSATNDTADFTVSGTGGSILQEASISVPWRMPNELKWLFGTSTPGASILSLNKPSTYASWYGIPVAIRPYTFWFVAVGRGTDGIVGVTPTITWLGPTGATLSTATGATVNSAQGQPTKMWVTSTPPFGTAFALCSLAASSATINAGDWLDIFSLSFHEGSAPDAIWYPGTGIKPVSILAQSEDVPLTDQPFRRSPTIVFKEVI